MIESKPTKSKLRKKINNRRKSRELAMKSIYRGLVNTFDLTQIQKDIREDPDFIRADEKFYVEILKGVFKSTLPFATEFIPQPPAIATFSS